MSEPPRLPRSPTLSRSLVLERTWPFFLDLSVAACGLALFYAVLRIAQYWMGHPVPAIAISPSAKMLPLYAFYSVVRIFVAYLLSLLFAVGYGYIAAYNPRAEAFMIAVLDILQSIPVLSFLPAVMLAMVSLIPGRQLGIEMGAILLIFTGQVWNLAFSFYSSLKSLPRELREDANVFRFTAWQRFWQLELPYSAIGLVWNSMVSVAGGWFFLMACEMFILGNRDLRLPGLGSYLQTAANAGDTRAIVWGLSVMIGIIVLIDQLIWRPVIAWSEKFKFEQVESVESPHSFVLDFLQRSKILPFLARVAVRPVREYLSLYFANRQVAAGENRKPGAIGKWISRVLLGAMLTGVAYAFVKMIILLVGLTRAELHGIFVGAGATLLRVAFTLVLAGLWTIPVGVIVGLKPKLSAIAQPLAQIAASVPATALFPIILLVLIKAGGGLGIGAIVLLLLGTQWYILFNVIAGAMAIPTDLKEVCNVFRFNKLERWRELYLPGIFPYLVTGFVTASGGAWNASIIAEYFRFKGHTYTVTGLGSVISDATDTGNYRVLMGATILMAMMVVTINRLLWRRLYALAATRFKLEG